MNPNDPDAMNLKNWDPNKYQKFYLAYHMNNISNINIQNQVGKVTYSQISSALATTYLTPAQLLQNFMHASKSIDKLMIFKEY